MEIKIAMKNFGKAMHNAERIVVIRQIGTNSNFFYSFIHIILTGELIQAKSYSRNCSKKIHMDMEINFQQVTLVRTFLK